jgi:histidine ammonia-lyase
MGTIAARDCLRVIELSEQVAAAMLIAARQALHLRRRVTPEAGVTEEAAAMLVDLEAHIELVEEDRALDADLRVLLAAIRTQRWRLYAE